MSYHAFRRHEGTSQCGNPADLSGLFQQQKQRIVQIEGEAYFDVAPDKEHPFIVKTSHTSIRVTGTSFNVRAYADEDTESTTLISGTVRINSGNEEFELVPQPALYI